MTSVKVDLSDSEEQVAQEGESDVEGFWSPISSRESAPAPGETVTAPPAVPPVFASPPPPVPPPSVPKSAASVVNLAESSSTLPEPVPGPRKKERLSFNTSPVEDPFPALPTRNPPARASQARVHSAEPRSASEEQRQVDKALPESLAAAGQLPKTVAAAKAHGLSPPPKATAWADMDEDGDLVSPDPEAPALPRRPWVFTRRRPQCQVR